MPSFGDVTSCYADADAGPLSFPLFSKVAEPSSHSGRLHRRVLVSCLPNNGWTARCPLTSGRRGPYDLQRNRLGDPLALPTPYRSDLEDLLHEQMMRTAINT